MRKYLSYILLALLLCGQAQGQDTLSTAKKQAIDARITYTSQDSMVITGNGVAHMYGSGELQYKSMGLKAEYIRVNMDSSMLYAQGVMDTIENEWVGKPVFSEGNDSYETEQIRFNLKTQKALIRNAVTEQGEGYIIADKTKKVENDVLMMAGGKYTTCNDHDHPHFYMQLTKAKVKPGSYIASGPAYLVVGDVPLPLAIPFGFFPFTHIGLYHTDSGYILLHRRIQSIILGESFLKVSGTFANNKEQTNRQKYNCY